MPNWALSNYFTHSILIQIKITLEAVFPMVRGAFLLRGKKIGLNLRMGNCLHKVGGVYLSALHHITNDCQQPKGARNTPCMSGLNLLSHWVEPTRSERAGDLNLGIVDATRM